MTNSKQLSFPGLEEMLNHSNRTIGEPSLENTTKRSATIIDFHKEKLKMEREKERQQLESFLDYYKVF